MKTVELLDRIYTRLEKIEGELIELTKENKKLREAMEDLYIQNAKLKGHFDA